MIQSIRLQNFKAIKDIEVGLERLTVFVGANASGKTSILQALNFLVNGPDLARIDYGAYLMLVHDYLRLDFGQVDIASLVSADPMALACSTDSGDVSLHVAGADASPVVVRGQNLFAAARGLVRDALGDGLHQGWSWHRDLSAIESLQGYAQFFRLNADLMALPASGSHHRLPSDGRSLGSKILELAETQPDEFERLQVMLQQVVPSIARIRLDLIRNPPYFAGPEATANLEKMVVFEMKSGRNLPARSVSEGMLLALGLFIILVDPHRPNLVLIDDLDRGLHPLAQGRVVALFREIMELQPDLQIVATTHSPYLLDSLRPEEVRMTTLNDDGTVACGRLVDHPQFERWKGEMAPGEIWSMFGEKWVSQHPAQAAEAL